MSEGASKVEIVESSRFAAFRIREYRNFAFARFTLLLSHQMLILVVSQHIYVLTRDPLDLGFIGLAIFLPKFLLMLLGGQIADTYDRRDLLLACRVVQTSAAAWIWYLVASGSEWTTIYFICMALIGTAAAFDGPASTSLYPRLVSRALYPNAVTWNAAIQQLAVVTGPALAGILYAIGFQTVTILPIIVALRILSFGALVKIRTRTAVNERRTVNVESMLAGLRFIFKSQILLGAISLDLFSVLLGGAVALLPVYANDILLVGPKGLGMLRSAPAIGAGMMAIFLAYRPITSEVGRVLFLSVAVFGAATVAFGISRQFLLSIGLLVVLGAADMVSMVVRGTLVQLYTPDHMRGRVGAANQLFIGASNELGEFESGVTARFLGVVPAVVLGGIGTLVVAALWTKHFPRLRRLNSFDVGST